MFKRYTYILLVLSIIALPCFAQTEEASMKDDDSWAAKINGQDIPMKKYMNAANFSEKEYLSKVGDDAKITSVEAKEISRSILEQMIESEIITQWARRSMIKVSDKEISKKIAEMKKKFPSNYQFHKSLANRGMSADDLKRSVKRDLIVEKVLKIKYKESIVTDEEIQRFYDKNIDLYVQKGKVHLKHILVGSKEKAENVIKKLDDGEEFEEIAKRMSEDDETKSEGGDLGIIEEGQLDPEVEAVVFKLKAKTVSDIVETEKRLLYIQG